MTSVNRINHLIERFFEGATTLAEERELYAYFSEANVAPSLEPLRELFGAFADLPTEESVPAPPALTASGEGGEAPAPLEMPPISETAAQAASPRFFASPAWRRAAAGIAAAVVIAGGAGFLMAEHSGDDRQANFCEAYVYGHRVTDREAVMREVDASLADAIEAANSMPTIEAEITAALEGLD